MRYDFWDKGTAKPDDAKSRVFIGTGLKITDGVRMTVDYSGVIQEKEGGANKNQSAVATHWEIKF